jgi:hypothetical protein
LVELALSQAQKLVMYRVADLKRGTCRKGKKMRYVGAIAVLLASSPATVIAGKEAGFTDEQLACVNAQFVLRETAGGLMSVDDTIALRRLQEGYCKQYAACLSSNIADATLRETAIRAMFGDCLDDEAVKEK